LTTDRRRLRTRLRHRPDHEPRMVNVFRACERGHDASVGGARRRKRTPRCPRGRADRGGRDRASAEGGVRRSAAPLGQARRVDRTWAL